MKRFFIILLYTVTLPLHSIAQNVIIHNKSNYDLWISLYQKNISEYKQCTVPKKILKESSLNIVIPSSLSSAELYLTIDYVPTNLTSTVHQREWNNGIIHKNINYFYKKKFYIQRLNGILLLYNSIEWNISNPLLNAFTSLKESSVNFLTQGLMNTISAIFPNPHRDHTAYVREGNQLHPAEKLCMQKRKHVIHKKLEQYYNCSFAKESIPTISCAFSGGGLRASAATLGSLIGLEKTGLMDTVLFGAFISGSSWSHIGWSMREIPLEDYKKEFFNAVSQGIIPKSIQEYDHICNALFVKMIEGQPITIVDIFGALIANTLFGYYTDNPHQCYLSQTKKRIRDGKHFLPIYNAINANQSIDVSWFEFTPYEAGSALLQKYIPLWALGRKCIDGNSVDFAPEQTCGYMMGIFGSAFAAQIGEIYDTFKDSIQSHTIKNIIETLLKPVNNDRLTCAKLYNFSTGMFKYAIPQELYLTYADAGSNPGFNFPYPSLSEERPDRSSDIIIFFDMGVADSPGEPLLQAQHYAQTHNLKFPPISIDTIYDNTLTVFKDNNDQSVPIIIYMPLINNASLEHYLNRNEYAAYKDILYNFDIHSCISLGKCTTFTATYDTHTSECLAALAELQIMINKDTIYEIIRSKIDDNDKGTYV